MKKNIPFSRPLINQDVISEMMDTLQNTGWLTSGPKTLAFEKEIRQFTNCPAVVCVNSWTSGAMLMLRWFGVGPGDEVIVPAYTYCATALCVLNMGATPVMVDVRADFTIDTTKLAQAITGRTKAVIPVDIGGWPCDYDGIKKIILSPEVLERFAPASENQKKLGRILLIADAAHSIGATTDGIQSGNFADISVFSFHSVKNITTGEGGAICVNLPAPFDNAVEYRFLKTLSLNGQNKSAFEKNQPGSWRYDIIAPGLKVNMPDVCAAIGLAQIRKYKSEMLPERRRIFDFYTAKLSAFDWAILPAYDKGRTVSSFHLYLLRIKGITEEQRDRMIHLISLEGVGVNVHYIPMAMLTLFKTLGFKIEDYPMTQALYSNEITLPVYNGLTGDQLTAVVGAVVCAYNAVHHDG